MTLLLNNSGPTANISCGLHCSGAFLRAKKQQLNSSSFSMDIPGDYSYHYEY
jgi:hypothetical protein